MEGTWKPELDGFNSGRLGNGALRASVYGLPNFEEMRIGSHRTRIGI